MQVIAYILIGSVLGTILILLGYYLGIHTVRSTYLEITQAHYSNEDIDKVEEKDTTSNTNPGPYNWDDYDTYITGDDEFEEPPEA